MTKWIFGVICALAAACSHAFTVKPIDGLWSIDSELNLSIGRAFNLELSGPYLIVSFYNYNAQGAPTFYVTAGLLGTNNRMTAGLSEPQGGTCLGCTPTSGSVRSSPGNVTFEFVTSTKGYVTLPGEARKAISKGAITWPAAPAGLRGVWAFTSMSTSSSSPIAVADVAILSTQLAATSTGSGLVASANGKYGCEYQTSGTLAGQVFCLMLGSTSNFDKVSTSYWWGDNMDGVWRFSNVAVTDLFVARRIVSPNGDQLDIKALEAQDAAMQDRLYRSMQAYIDAANTRP